MQQLQGYYDRYDPSKNYDKHLFRAGYVLQSAELNEIQSASQQRLRGIADALFKDGDVVRDARLVVNADTGECSAEAGAIYIAGAVRGVAPKTFTIPTTGQVSVGVYLSQDVMTELDDPALRDPATGVRNYQEAGAARLRVVATWGFFGDGNTNADFFPVYAIEDGVLKLKEPPPQLDSVTQALARYDRDSAGGTYVSEGMTVSEGGIDGQTGNQVYWVAAGRSRVQGLPVESLTSRRVSYAALPDTLRIESEPHTSSGIASQRIVTDRHPIATIESVKITAEKAVTITHGSYSGVNDPLPDNSVLSIVEVKQGGTTYVAGTDYRLQAGGVDWSLTGAEPATGSSYTVKYRYIATATPESPDLTGFNVTGAIAGTLVLVTYAVNLPRWDRLCLNSNGEFVWVKGVPSQFNPALPQVSNDLLPLCRVYQSWDASKYMQQDGTRMVPMSDIANITTRLDAVVAELAKQRLASDVAARDSSIRKGLFVEPFIDDTMRDQGIAQNGSIFGGELQLPITASVANMSQDVARATTALDTYSAGVTVPAAKKAVALQQLARTGAMKINPYQSAAIVPASCVLSPSVDRWTEVQTSWTSAMTQVFYQGGGWLAYVVADAWSNQRVSSVSSAIANLRQIDVKFTLTGFGPNETLSKVTFDGVDVTGTVLAA